MRLLLHMRINAILGQQFGVIMKEIVLIIKIILLQEHILNGIIEDELVSI